MACASLSRETAIVGTVRVTGVRIGLLTHELPYPGGQLQGNALRERVALQDCTDDFGQVIAQQFKRWHQQVETSHGDRSWQFSVPHGLSQKGNASLSDRSLPVMLLGLMHITRSHALPFWHRGLDKE
jgi:hypothetical protein